MNKCDSLCIFEELSRIPRPSGKEEKVVQYLIEYYLYLVGNFTRRFK